MIEAKKLVVYEDNVLKAIEEADCDDVTRILEALFPDVAMDKPDDTTFNQARIELYLKDHTTDWNAYIGVATKGELRNINPSLYDNSDNDGATIVITIPQGDKQCALDNITEMMKQDFALSLNGVMDKNR